MAGVDHRHLGPVAINRPTFVKASDLDPFGRGEIAHKVVDPRDFHPLLFGDGHRIAGMIAVAMGEKNMGDTGHRFGAAPGGEHRVARQPRVNQQNRCTDFDAKAGMAKPDDFHREPSLQKIEVNRPSIHILTRRKRTVGRAPSCGLIRRPLKGKPN